MGKAKHRTSKGKPWTGNASNQGTLTLQLCVKNGGPGSREAKEVLIRRGQPITQPPPKEKPVIKVITGGKPKPSTKKLFSKKGLALKRTESLRGILSRLMEDEDFPRDRAVIESIKVILEAIRNLGSYIEECEEIPTIEQKKIVRKYLETIGYIVTDTYNLSGARKFGELEPQYMEMLLKPCRRFAEQ